MSEKQKSRGGGLCCRRLRVVWLHQITTRLRRHWKRKIDAAGQRLTVCHAYLIIEEHGESVRKLVGCVNSRLPMIVGARSKLEKV